MFCAPQPLIPQYMPQTLNYFLLIQSFSFNVLLAFRYFRYISFDKLFYAIIWRNEEVIGAQLLRTAKNCWIKKFTESLRKQYVHLGLNKANSDK